MSTNVEGTVPAYDDAEKGTLEVNPEQMAIVPLGYKGKREDTATVIAKEVTPAATKLASKPAGKKKKKVSKWILWQLWFNTYRFVLLDSSEGPDSDISNRFAGNSSPLSSL